MSNVAKLYEIIGRKQAEIEDRTRCYDAVQEVLAGVVDGSIDRSRVLVNKTDRTWAVADPGCRPGMPAQVNGVPVCVVAPDEPEAKKPAEPKTEPVPQP